MTAPAAPLVLTEIQKGGEWGRLAHSPPRETATVVRARRQALS
jgi:hypothetical protein